MFVNGAPFLITMSHGIKFVTLEIFTKCMANQLSKSLKRVIKIYSRSSMVLQTVLIYMEFDKTIDELMKNAVVSTSAAK